MKRVRLTVFTDESRTDRDDLRFHHFYGGALVKSKNIQPLEDRLEGAILPQFRWKEHKWSKVSQKSYESFESFIKEFFKIIREGHLKLRVLFIDKLYYPPRKAPSKDILYYKIYYQLFKHCLGLQYANIQGKNVIISVKLDQIPKNKIEKAKFKQFISRIPKTKNFGIKNVSFPINEIVEVDSKKYRILQAVDTVIGSLGFKLNKVFNDPANRLPNNWRKPTTRTKRKLYKVIQKELKSLGVQNVGISTGLRGNIANRWSLPVRLWKLLPKISLALPN
jgi:hypothetical protein